MESFEVQAVLSAIDKGFTDVMKQAQKSTEGFEDTQKKAGLSFDSILKGVGVYKAVDLGINAITGSLGGAIDRFDTLNNSTRSFENMGFSAKETEKTMEDLKASIQGLPTPLDGAIKGVQLLASSTEDIGKSQKIFRALNDGILGFGGTTDQVNNAIIQLSQSFSNGKVDAETWNSMINSGLGPSLAAIAKTMNMTTGELKEGLSKGRVSVEEFQNALISLDENGGGGLKSLQQIAKDSTAGIKTGIANAKTAIVRGVANLISAVDEGLAKTDLKSIGSIIANIGSSMEKGLTQAAQYIPPILNAVGVAIKFVGDNADWLIPILSGVASGFVAFSAAEKSIKVITDVQKAFSEFKGITSLIGMIGPAGWIAIGIGAVVAASILLYKNWDTVKEVASNVWNGVKDIIGGVSDWIIDKWEGTKSFFNGIWDGITGTTKSVWDGVSSTVSDSAQKTKDDWGDIKSFFKDTWEQTERITKAFWGANKAVFKQAVEDVKAEWATITNFFKGVWDSVIEGVNNFISVVSDKFNFIKSLFSPLITALSNIKGYFMVAAHNAIVGMVDIFKDGFTILKNVVLAPVLFIASLISGGWDEAISNMKAVWENITTAFKDIWINIQFIFISTITAIKNTLNAAWNGIFISAQKVWTQIQLFFTTLWINITTSIKTAWIDVKLFFTNLWIEIVYGVQTAWTNIQTFVTDTITNTIQGAKDLWNSFTTFLSDLWTGIKSTVSNSVTQTKTDTVNTWDSLIQWAKDTWNGFTTFLSTTWDNIVNGAKQAWDNMKQGISDAIQAVKDTFDKLREIDLFEIGKNIIDGLVNGIKDGVNRVKDAVTGVASSITDKVKNILHIASPSKVMKKMGGFTAEGLAIGIADGAKGVSKASDLLAQAAQPDLNMSASLADMNGSMNSMIQHEANMSGSKKSATFNIRLGNQQFSAFVDDISQAMGQDSEINLSF